MIQFGSYLPLVLKEELRGANPFYKGKKITLIGDRCNRMLLLFRERYSDLSGPIPCPVLGSIIFHLK